MEGLVRGEAAGAAKVGARTNDLALGIEKMQAILICNQRSTIGQSLDQSRSGKALGGFDYFALAIDFDDDARSG